MTHSLRKTLLILSICFIAMLTWLTTFTVMAFSVSEPMMDKAYYRKGMDYQKRLDALARGRAAGWVIEPSIKDGRLKAGTSRIPVYLRNRKGSKHTANSQNAVLNVVLERPASTRNSRRYRLEHARPGNDGARVFDLELKVPAPGYWELLLEVELGDDVRVYHRKRFYADR